MRLPPAWVDDLFVGQEATRKIQGVTPMLGALFLRSGRRRRLAPLALTVLLALLASSATTERATGQAQPGTSLLAPDLELRTVVDGLALPTSIAFLGSDDLLVLEKNSGKVKRVVNGVV